MTKMKRTILSFLCAIVLIFDLFCYCFSLIFSFYVHHKTTKEYGNDVVYFTDKSGAFSTSGYPAPRIWCTKNIKDIPFLSILIRAALIYTDLDWNLANNTTNPIHFGIVDNNNEAYIWSFRKMDYVNIVKSHFLDRKFTFVEINSYAEKCAKEIR